MCVTGRVSIGVTLQVEAGQEVHGGHVVEEAAVRIDCDHFAIFQVFGWKQKLRVQFEIALLKLLTYARFEALSFSLFKNKTWKILFWNYSCFFSLDYYFLVIFYN